MAPDSFTVHYRLPHLLATQACGGYPHSAFVDPSYKLPSDHKDKGSLWKESTKPLSVRFTFMRDYPLANRSLLPVVDGGAVVWHPNVDCRPGNPGKNLGWICIGDHWRPDAQSAVDIVLQVASIITFQNHDDFLEPMPGESPHPTLKPVHPCLVVWARERMRWFPLFEGHLLPEERDDEIEIL